MHHKKHNPDRKATAPHRTNTKHAANAYANRKRTRHQHNHAHTSRHAVLAAARLAAPVHADRETPDLETRMSQRLSTFEFSIPANHRPLRVFPALCIALPVVKHNPPLNKMTELNTRSSLPGITRL